MMGSSGLRHLIYEMKKGSKMDSTEAMRQDQMMALFDKIEQRHQRRVPDGCFTVRMYAEDRGMDIDKARLQVRYAESQGVIERVLDSEGNFVRGGSGNTLVYREVDPSQDDEEECEQG